jgi:aspartyl/asparaginyl beta-hydroxylase (cupin superfamily)
LLQSGAYIKPHKCTDLMYHLCLSGICILNVNNQLIEQTPGKVTIFDSKYTHSVRNPFKRDLLILYINFLI